jgi:hypothetical protein
MLSSLLMMAPSRLSTVEAMVETVAAEAVEAMVDSLAATVEAAVDSPTSMVEAL